MYYIVVENINAGPSWGCNFTFCFPHSQPGTFLASKYSRTSAVFDTLGQMRVFFILAHKYKRPRDSWKTWHHQAIFFPQPLISVHLEAVLQALASESGLSIYWILSVINSDTVKMSPRKGSGETVRRNWPNESQSVTFREAGLVVN